MRRYTIRIGDTEYTIDVQDLASDRFRVQVGGRQLDVRLVGEQPLAEALISPAMAVHDGAPHMLPIEPPPASLPAPAAPAPMRAMQPGGPGQVRAPMPGQILAVDVTAGQRVSQGQVLLTFEAMKMHNAIRAPAAGVVLEVLVQPGQKVAYNDLLVRLGEAPA